MNSKLYVAQPNDHQHLFRFHILVSAPGYDQAPQESG